MHKVSHVPAENESDGFPIYLVVNDWTQTRNVSHGIVLIKPGLMHSRRPMMILRKLP